MNNVYIFVFAHAYILLFSINMLGTDIIASNETKYCSSCKVFRQANDFVRTKGQKAQVYSTCNVCSTNRSVSKQTEKASTLTPNLEKSNSEIDTEIEHGGNEDNSDGLVYNVTDMEAAIKTKFTCNDDQPISFSLEVELDDEMASTDTANSAEITVNQNSESVQEIAKYLQVYVENGSEYYWEMRNTHVNKKLGEPTGVVTTYFGCAQSQVK